MKKMKKGFTLIEMLVVIGILGVLMGAGMATFNGVTKKAQKAKAQELVLNVATALDAVYQKEGFWPPRLMREGASNGEMNPENAFELARRYVMTLSFDKDRRVTTGIDCCGVVSPWAQAVVKRRGTSASLSDKVPTGGTVSDHLVHFAIDTEGNGYVNASVGGESIRIRATAVAWCCGPDGTKKHGYREGLRKGTGVYSWTDAQIVK